MFNVACKQNNIPDEFSEPGGDSDGGTTPVDPEPENNEESNNGSEEEVAPDPNRPDIDLKPLDEDGNIIDEPEGSVENVTQETEKQKTSKLHSPRPQNSITKRWYREVSAPVRAVPEWAHTHTL